MPTVDPDGALATPVPVEHPIIAALMEGTVLVDVPPEWGEPEQSPRVDEGYILQDFTWFLDGSPEGDIVTAAGMTPGQSEALSGGASFADHVAGLRRILAFEGAQEPALERIEVTGVQAARIDATSPEGMRIVLWLFDLDAAIYELGFYGAPGTAPDPERIAQLDAVARTFTLDR